MVTEKIINEICSINKDSKTEISEKNSYNYLIVLSDEDLVNRQGLELKFSYKPDAGLIFKLVSAE